MCLIKKTISKKDYYYLSSRHGKRIVHKYVGTAGDRLAKALLALENRQKSVPNDFRHLFWDTDPEKLDFGKNGRYVIERVLELGSLDAFEWILKIFSLKKIIEVFVTSRNISKKSANFWMIWFGIENA